MDLLTTKRKPMRSILIPILALALWLPAAASAQQSPQSSATESPLPVAGDAPAARQFDGQTAEPSAAPRSAAAENQTGYTTGKSAEHHQPTINELRSQRGLTDTHNLFIPKGQWIFGGTASYSTHTNKSYQFLVVEGINSTGYTFKVSPMIAYAFRSNMALGGRFIYSRTLLKLDNASINFGDEDSNVNLKAQDYYALQHSYQVAAIWRQYIPLGRNKRFALFNEMSLAGGGTEARFANGSPVKGTYQTGYTFSLGISPGIIAFATNNMAVEVNVGVMGITFNHTEQVHNQVTVGERNLSQMNFKVNIFSIGLGMAFYL